MYKKVAISLMSLMLILPGLVQANTGSGGAAGSVETSDINQQISVESSNLAQSDAVNQESAGSAQQTATQADQQPAAQADQQTSAQTNQETAAQAQADQNATTKAASAANDDYEGPTLVRSTFSPSNVKVGDTITITAKVSDPSGVSKVTAQLYGQTIRFVELAYNSATDTWTGSYKVKEYDHDGVWFLSLGMVDNNGNENWADADQSITVTNPNEDREYPVLNDVSFEPQSLKAGEEFTIAVDASDDIGVESIDARFFEPDGNFNENKVSLTYDGNKNKWVGTYTFDKNTAPGEGDVQLTIIDKSSNQTVETRNYQMTNETGDFTDPAIGDVTLSQTTINAGEQLKVQANITDDKSGLEDASVGICSDDFGCYMYPLEKNNTTGLLYEGSADIPRSFKPGTYQVVVEATDKAGNYSRKTLDQTLDIHNDGDYSPPVIEDLQISPATAKPGEEINFTATMTDTESSVKQVEVQFSSKSGQFRFVDLTLDEQTGKWTGSYQVRANDESGDWSFEVAAADQYDNWTWYNSDKKISIDNPDADFLAPVVDSVALSAAKVSLGEDLVITAAVHDDKSGVNEVSAYLTSPSGEGRYVTLSYDENLKKWVGSYTISQRDEPGEWTLSELDLTDNADNRSMERLEDKVFTVDNPDADFTAPVFEEINFSPKAAKVGDHVKITAKAHDDKSGIEEFMVSLTSQDEIQRQGVDLSYDESTDEWVGWFNVGPNTMPGEWTISSIYLSDFAGNVSPAYPEASFTVDNPNGDFMGPVISNTQVTPSTVRVGEKVTITTEAVDDQSGVKEVTANLYNEVGDYSYKEVRLRYNSTSKKWTGTFEVQETTRPGTWQVEIYAKDIANNYSSDTSNKTFTVINTTGDYTGPTIKSLEVTPTTVNAGGKVTFTAAVTDDKSGVGAVWAYVDYIGKVIFKLDSKSGKWVATATVPTNVPDGEEIFVNDIYAFDYKGNDGNAWFEKSFIVHNSTGDYTAPAVDAKSIVISPADVTAGGKIQIKAKVTDTQTGVKEVVGYFGEDYQPHFFNLKYEQSTGLWVADYTVSSNEKPGSWALSLYVEDNNGNYDIVETGKMIKISNPNADLSEPVIKNILITPSTANVGDKVTITATIEDLGSGVLFAEAYLNPSYEEYGSQIVVPLAYNKDQKKWVGSYVVTEIDMDGVWEANVFASDHYNNTTDSTLNFQVNNPIGDTDAPFIDDVKVSKSIANVGDTVDFEVKISDEKSGIKSASINLGLAESYAYITIPLTYDKTKDVWKGSYKVPAYAQAGLIMIGVYAEDKAGNTIDDYVDKRLWINNDNPDTNGPTVEAVDVTPSQAAIGQTVHFKVALKDDMSGVKFAQVYLYSGGAFGYYQQEKLIDLTYDAAQKVWVGAYTILPTDYIGSWNVDIWASDNAGNSIYKDAMKTLVITAVDNFAPAKPVVNEVSDKDTTVTGKAEAGSKVEVKANGLVIGSAAAGKDGKFTVTIPAQKAGAALTITATDAAGNISEAATITVVTALVGWVQSGTTWYYYVSGKKVTGWQQVGGTWYYFDKTTAAMKTGWVQEGSTWYFFNGSGAMVTGWLQSGGTWYYFVGSGAMKTGWMQSGTTWYYFASSGAMATGWLQSGGTWYYFVGSGAMKTGWMQSGGTWYYFASGGAMKTGWLQSGGAWYYFAGSGAMETSWVSISGKWYYFYSSGVLK
ncbi:Ig-like domain-containing protein [Bacillus salipaludis]|uniref:Ig-like domain-containing protein n=1 Tax=Bacillus salipaludis TaxID=2547811 RepID=A0ABW8RDE6_9BACI